MVSYSCPLPVNVPSEDCSDCAALRCQNRDKLPNICPIVRQNLSIIILAFAKILPNVILWQSFWHCQNALSPSIVKESHWYEHLDCQTNLWFGKECLPNIILFVQCKLVDWSVWCKVIDSEILKDLTVCQTKTSEDSVIRGRTYRHS